MNNVTKLILLAVIGILGVTISSKIHLHKEISVYNYKQLRLKVALDCPNIKSFVEYKMQDNIINYKEHAIINKACDSEIKWKIKRELK